MPTRHQPAAHAYGANHLVATSYAVNAPAAQVATAHVAMAYAASAHAANLSPGIPDIDGSGEGMQLLPGVGDQANLTMTTIDLLQAMMDRLSSGSMSVRSTTKNYDWVELEYLSSTSGPCKSMEVSPGWGQKASPNSFSRWPLLKGKKQTPSCSWSATSLLTIHRG
jgi:hypothetical protein